LDAISKQSNFTIGNFIWKEENSETKAVVGKEEAITLISQNWEMTGHFCG